MFNCSRAHWQEPSYKRYGNIWDVLKDTPPEGKRLQFKPMLNYTILHCLNCTVIAFVDTLLLPRTTTRHSEPDKCLYQGKLSLFVKLIYQAIVKEKPKSNKLENIPKCKDRECRSTMHRRHLDCIMKKPKLKWNLYLPLCLKGDSIY